LANSIRKKEVSSEEVINAHLERIEEVNPQINAVVQFADTAIDQAREADSALARGEIKGPLHGVPMTIKDNLDTAGVISTGGTMGRATFIPEKDATVVARMYEAGAILMGKTNTPEFTLSFETDNLIYGRTSNPYDLSRSSGGSSGGAAAIISTGGSPMDIGSDAAGSIRFPAHCCGTAGIKPTAGRVPRTGHIVPAAGPADAFNHIGPIARFVEDLALILPIISGPDWYDQTVVPMPVSDPDLVDLKALRAAIYTDNGLMTPTGDIVDVVNAAAKALSDTGMAVEEARPEVLDQVMEIFFGITGADGGSRLKSLLREYGTTDVYPAVSNIIERAASSRMSAVDLAELWARWDIFKSDMLSFMEQYDLIICPVSPFTALEHGATADPSNFIGFSYTITYNLTGWPCVVVRCGVSADGLPIGVQIVARPWREDVALAAGRHLERQLGGWQPPPI
jgi:amidase